jgi:hypothetical protein
MKKILSLILVLVVASVTFGATYANTSVPGGPFASSIQIQNLGTTEASVSIQYVNNSGGVALTTSHTIAASDVLSIYVPAESALASGEYSVVVSANQPVAAVSNFSDADSGAAYSGATAGALSWGFPAAYDNYYGYYTEIYAQNVAPAPQSIILEVYAPGNATPVYTNTKSAVPVNASVNWSLKDLAQLANNVSYSAVVKADGQIVAIGNTWGSGAAAAQLYSYNGFASGAKTFYVPALYKGYYGWNAALSIQNVSSTAAAVTVTYSGGTVKNYTIQPKSSVAIYIPAEAALPAGLMSATVTSDQDVAVSVNISNNANRAATYNGAAEATTKVFAPNVMKRYYKYSSSVTCQNLGTAATTMTISYAAAPGATETSGSIAPGASWEVYLPSKTAVPNGYNAGATIEAGQPIACIINSNMDEAPENTQSMDQLFSYNGVNQ